MKTFLSLMLLVLINQIAIAQNIKHFSYSEGLKGLYVRHIKHDNNNTLYVSTLNGLFRFNGYSFTSIKLPTGLQNQVIKDIYFDKKNQLWLLFSDDGLFKRSKGIWNKTIDSMGFEDKQANSIFKAENNNIIIATKAGLFFQKNEGEQKTILPEYNIQKVIQYDLNRLILGTKGALIIYYLDSKTFKKYNFTYMNSGFIHQLNRDKLGNIWLTTAESLLKFEFEQKKFTNLSIGKDMTRYISLSEYNQTLFIGTSNGEIFLLNTLTDKITRFQTPDKFKFNAIMSLHISQDQHLWIGDFFNGLYSVDLKTPKFTHEYLSSCSKEITYYSSYLDNEHIWIGTENGLFVYDNSTKECKQINLGYNKKNSITDITKQGDYLWISTASGVIQLDINSTKVHSIHKKYDYFSDIIFNPKDNSIVAYGIQSGLIKIASSNTKHINRGNLTVNDIKLVNNELIFATNLGLAHIIQDNQLKLIENLPPAISKQPISALYYSANGSLFVVTSNNHLFTLTKNMIEIEDIDLNIPTTTQINSIVTDDLNKSTWLGSDDGLIRVKDGDIHVFEYSDGTENNYYYKNFAFISPTKELYFGGENGFIHFKSKDIQLNNTPPNIIIEHFSLLNQYVLPMHKTSTGLLLEDEINNLDILELSYKDYIIGFDFVALDYADPMRNKYAYRLKGFQKDWVHTNAKNRKATYTNLNPRDYVFQVKASNKDGAWSKPKELKIIVHPAPWFSPLAYAVYIFFILFSIWSFIRYKTIASRKRALILEKTVDERTQEVERQKKMVESLLEHKNEVFANITHEFKTPLALILGPVEQLTKQKELIQHSGELTMIERNAKRLMLMVAQILKLSQAESDKEVLRESQSVQAILLMLFEAFSPLAKSKNINLELSNTNDVNVYATTECLEIVVGNLLSNAIKYTNDGGEVCISSKLINKQVSIKIKDSGAGIEEKDLSKIFKRFTRLDTHKNIAGTGIGLSVVKEITEANDGFVKVESSWGKESVFTVTFPITDIKPQEEMSEVMVDQLVRNTENELVAVQQLPKAKNNNNRVTVLVIEDNLDMQSHIGSVLGHRFNCLFADRGRKGIAIALKKLPDIIICDVMMPAMDGYQVTRILRHDGRTSHIPIVLLTALNTTQSRIKGWRENIDTYMTKPFNADELNAQIDNILITRKNLQKQTNQAIRSNSTLDSLNLSKQDEKFIDKFKDIIGKYYGNEYFQKADLASKMAISERQLQRKLKALIDQNPMEMLRDYRLEKAAMKLKDGYQVGIVSDECGFSSVSYFGSCFKKKYGITPKTYQTLNKK